MPIIVTRRSAVQGLALAGALLALAGCASGPTIRADQDPGANFSAYRTYGFVSPLSTDKKGYSTVLSSRLKQAVGRELESRGYRYAESNPDLLVNFFLNIQDKTEIRSTPSGPAYGGGYYGYRGGMYSGWGGNDIQTVDYKAGSLSIDVIDAARKQLVWTGIAEGRVSKEAQDNPGAAIDKVVTDIFANYPGRVNPQ